MVEPVDSQEFSPGIEPEKDLDENNLFARNLAEKRIFTGLKKLGASEKLLDTENPFQDKNILSAS